MHAYKAFNIDENGQLQYRDFIYEEGQTYEMDSKTRTNLHGFPAYLDYKDYNNLMDADVVLHHVEILGSVDTSYADSTIVTDKIKIGKPVTFEELAPLKDTAGSLEVMLFIKLVATQNGDMTQLIPFLHHKDLNVRATLAKYGTDEMRKQLVNDADLFVRLTITEFWNDDTLYQLVNDNAWIIRAKIAKYGNDELRQQLLNDESWCVRKAVAAYGTDELRLQLINDDVWCVRYSVAEYGTDEMRLQLLNDENDHVRSLARTLLKM